MTKKQPDSGQSATANSPLAKTTSLMDLVTPEDFREEPNVALTFQSGDLSDSLDRRDRRHTFNLDQRVWRDMGRPSQITVVVEPGDQLSAQPEQAQATEQTQATEDGGDGGAS